MSGVGHWVPSFSLVMSRREDTGKVPGLSHPHPPQSQVPSLLKMFSMWTLYVLPLFVQVSSQKSKMPSGMTESVSDCLSVCVSSVMQQ